MECAAQGIAWLKSTHSDDKGGDCVECAPIGAASWRKSSRSGDTGGSCVEIAPHPTTIAIRDSKNPTGPALALPPAAFAAFVAAVADGSL
ncbi:DUF397 domain-containing protein [Streptomyces sp. NPDC007100]|uniref:DUF397 domain-containing protein n=1 Tax=Streptomyces sp. NPDC007100 TaxID=3155602 RepID=UPI0033E8E74B